MNVPDNSGNVNVTVGVPSSPTPASVYFGVANQTVNSLTLNGQVTAWAVNNNINPLNPNAMVAVGSSATAGIAYAPPPLAGPSYSQYPYAYGGLGLASNAGPCVVLNNFVPNNSYVGGVSTAIAAHTTINTPDYAIGAICTPCTDNVNGGTVTTVDNNGNYTQVIDCGNGYIAIPYTNPTIDGGVNRNDIINALTVTRNAAMNYDVGGVPQWNGTGLTSTVLQDMYAAYQASGNAGAFQDPLLHSIAIIDDGALATFDPYVEDGFVHATWGGVTLSPTVYNPNYGPAGPGYGEDMVTGSCDYILVCMTYVGDLVGTGDLSAGSNSLANDWQLIQEAQNALNAGQTTISLAPGWGSIPVQGWVCGDLYGDGYEGGAFNGIGEDIGQLQATQNQFNAPSDAFGPLDPGNMNNSGAVWRHGHPGDPGRGSRAGHAQPAAHRRGRVRAGSPPAPGCLT